MTTIADVARLAGVSVATVSRALRGLDRVSPQTRARVMLAAEALEYVPSPTATSLASGRTRVVGVVVPFMNRWFFSTVVSGVERALRAHGYHVLLLDLEGDTVDARLRLTQTMLWKRVDGVIVLSVSLDDGERALLQRQGIPVVTVGAKIGSWPCVRIDDALAAGLATGHILSLGHTRVAYLGALPSAAHLTTPVDRRLAFLDRLAESALTCRPDWVVESDWTAAAAARDVRPLLRAAERPSAVVAASDEMAFGVLSAARELGLDVPGDLSVVGIDDHTLSGVFGLTTVRQDVAQQGRLAGAALLAELDDRPAPGDQVLPVELVVRATTARARTARGGAARGGTAQGGAAQGGAAQGGTPRGGAAPAGTARAVEAPVPAT